MLQLFKLRPVLAVPPISKQNAQNSFFVTSRLISKHPCDMDKKKQCSGQKQESGKQCSAKDDSKQGGEMCSGRDDDSDSKPEGDGDVPRIAINGFGRIGRMVMRVATEHSCPLEIVAINDMSMTTEHMAYMLKYDSTHGRFIGDVEVDGTKLIVDGKPLCTYQEKDPKNLPWREVGVDYVVESTGKLKLMKQVEPHLNNGAKKVVITAPSKDAPMYVVGVNHECYNPCQNVVSAASCATNALAPLAKVIHENFEIEEGLMTTVHASTGSQKILDTATPKNWRESRSALQNIIPTYTGAAMAVTKVLPELEGKMNAIAIRVPTANVSNVDLTCRLKKEATLDDIKCVIHEAMNGPMQGIIDMTEDDVVSSDFNGCHFSCTFDSKASMALNKHFFKLIAWFDNEYGYTCRVIDLIKYMHAERQRSC